LRSIDELKSVKVIGYSLKNTFQVSP